MLDIQSFEPSDSRAKDIFNHLSESGFDVYFSGTAVGEVKSSGRLVIKQQATGKIDGASSTDTFYDVLCYVPASNPESLQSFVESVKQSMKELFPMIVPTYNETAPYLDDQVKGYMSSVMYKNHRKIEV